MSSQSERRRLLTAGIAFAVAPLLGRAGDARAATNAALRAKLHYRDTPNGDESCANCVDFVAGATDEARGGCKRIPEDDQIAPTGYCDLWNTL